MAMSPFTQCTADVAKKPPRDAAVLYELGAFLDRTRTDAEVKKDKVYATLKHALGMGATGLAIGFAYKKYPKIILGAIASIMAWHASMRYQFGRLFTGSWLKDYLLLTFLILKTPPHVIESWFCQRFGTPDYKTLFLTDAQLPDYYSILEQTDDENAQVNITVYSGWLDRGAKPTEIEISKKKLRALLDVIESTREPRAVS